MKIKSVLVCVLGLVLLAAANAADNTSLPFVSPMFGDNMVLQRGEANTIWGWSKPGDMFRVDVAGPSRWFEY